MEKVNSLIILAGGASSRMKKQINSDVFLTDEEKLQANNRSKALIAIDKSDRPILDYLLLNAKRAGFNTIYIVTSAANSLFKTLYGTKDKGNEFNGLTINYAVQYIPKDREKPFGTADALYQAMSQYPELKKSSFVVCNSDNLYSKNAFKLLRNPSKFPNALIAYNRDSLKFSIERISRFALLSIDENNCLKSIIEKPNLEQIDNFKDIQGNLRVSMNIFRFSGKMIFPYLENCPIHKERNEKELPTALLHMIENNLNSAITILLDEHVPDLTSKEDIHILKEYVKGMDISNFE